NNNLQQFYKKFINRLPIKLLNHTNINNHISLHLKQGEVATRSVDGGVKKCCKYRTYSIFGVFRFLLSRGIYIHLPSQENEIQNLSQQSVV
ncbi:MAG: hypothetical protein Q4C99_09405, partial [Clostridia bacterium]|nr:hypothetical protein [Clostridia bacterium]